MLAIPNKIKDAILNNNLVIFVGSGLSIKFNLPDWTKLVLDVIKKIDKDNYNVFIPVLEMGAMSPLEILDKLKPEHNEIKKYISNNFKISNVDFSLHEKLIDLSSQIITTNYDNAFEESCKYSITPAIYTSDFNISEINKSNKPYIFKLHGSYSEPDKCIIFREDYDTLYSSETAAKEKLKSIFTEKLILFIGFGFNDADISLIFNNLDKTFSNNNKHFILTKNSDKFKNYKFLETITINDFDEIEQFIDTCLNLKEENKKLDNNNNILETNVTALPKIAFLSPNPLDINLGEEFFKIINCFDNLNIVLHVGTLNLKTLLNIEDFDLVIIASKVFKSNIYIEDDNLKSNLISPTEICFYIPNDKIPVIFITNKKIELSPNYPAINISTFRNAIINRFIYKALKEGELNFKEDEILINLKILLKNKVKKGTTKITSLYNNNKNLEIGKKCLTNVIGRIEEQSSIALKLLSLNKTNKLLNIKASGGTGKTTLIKKISYELYNRGYYKDGVNFKSCENIRSFADFEEILIDGFNLTNILNFKDYLKENHTNNKLDLLIILDNFETVVNSLSSQEFSSVNEILRFVTDFANIVVTSREKLSPHDDFEDVYSLTPLITDDALALFQKDYGLVTDPTEIKILRTQILEDLLNNNPLAIKLVTKSRTRFQYIEELRAQLSEHFFESTNEDYTLVFRNNADLNIERNKSIYQSINYSYMTLSEKEKISFELLNLFPDGISLSNFKKCFKRSSFTNNISDKELRTLRDKSLVEDYNGNLQLQPIIRRFAEVQFNKRSDESKQKYSLDAYRFNSFILEVIELIENKKSRSEALKLYSFYKNNLLNVLNYLTDIEISENGFVPEKKLLLNFVYGLENFIANEKQIEEFQNKIKTLQSYFSDILNANKFISVLKYSQKYFYKEFDTSYYKLCKILSVKEMETRVFSNEDYLERRYNNIISNVHSMEGYSLKTIDTYIKNNYTKTFLESTFFYLGIINNISIKKHGFYFFEYESMFNRLKISDLEDYISKLYLEEHLEIMQSTYTLSKVKILDIKVIQKLVITNPYTKGLKELMYAFISKTDEEKISHFEIAINHLTHIKYYYLEALFYYCIFLKKTNYDTYIIKVKEGLDLSSKFHYQYLNFLFKNIDNIIKPKYEFNYSYYPLNSLEGYVNKHNLYWDKEFRENKIDN